MIELQETSTGGRATSGASPALARLASLRGLRRTEALVERYWPALATPLALLFALWVFARQHSVHRVSDFIYVGRMFAAPFHIEALATSPVGYDGQFTYYMARFPGALPQAFDLPALRYSRMLQPLLVRIVSLGNADLMPWALLALNIAAITGTVALVCWLLRERGLPLWLALVPGFYSGQALAMERDLTDPLAIFFLALALVMLQRRRWLGAGAALGLGMLTRESTLLFGLCLALPLLFERRWRTLAGYLALVFVPYAIWQTLLYLWLGTWGWHQTSTVNTFVPLPFYGLLAAPDIHNKVQMFLFAGVPALLGIALGALALWERPWRDPLRLAAAAAALLYGMAMILQPDVHWLDIWEPMRLAAPLAVLLPFLAPRRMLQPAWLVVLAMMIFSFNTALLT